MSKQIKLVIGILLSLFSTQPSLSDTLQRGYDFKYNGVLYHILSEEAKTCEVTSVRNIYGENTPYHNETIDIPTNANGYTVIGISDQAFTDSDKLKTISIPNSVTYIGASAFSGCTSLTYIDIPDSVTKIEPNTFRNCTSLTGVDFPAKLNYIGGFAFYNCNSLSTVALPEFFDDNVIYIGQSTIGQYAFANCTSITSIYIPESLGTVESHTSGSIGPCAFNNCISLMSIDIPKGVYVGRSAFGACSSLSSITLRQSGVADDAFDNIAPDYKLFLITANANPFKEERDPLLKRDVNTYREAFKDAGIIYLTHYTPHSSSEHFPISTMEHLSSIFEVDGIKYVPVSSEQQSCAVIDCTYTPANKTVVIPAKVNYRGHEMAVAETCSYALCNNKFVENLQLKYSGAIATGFAQNCTNLRAIDFGSVDAIGDYAFLGCCVLNEINLPVNLSQMGCYAFSGCRALGGEIKIPAKLKRLDEGTFSNCISLQHIDFSNLEEIGSAAFYGVGLSEISFPPTVSLIGPSAFASCNSLVKVEVCDGKKPLSLFSTTFHNSPLSEVYIGRNIKNGVKEHDFDLFNRISSLEKVTFGTMVTEVCGFQECNALKEVALGENVTRILSWSFRSCSNLKTISLGGRITEIGDDVFSGCTGLAQLYAAPITPPACGNSAFFGVNRMACTLYVPESAVELYKAADQWKDFFFIEPYEFSSVNGVIADIDHNADGPYEVYNLAGIKVISTTDINEVNSLPAGVYIVNGEKKLIR